jgi:hypothetical protein
VIFRALLAAIACLASAACNNPVDSYPGQTSTAFDGNKQLVVVADFSPNAQAIGIVAWADVDTGTAATIEMTGPFHMHCDGTFQPVPATFHNPGNRPALDVGDGHVGAQFHAPAGQYTAAVSIPSKKVRLTRSFLAGISYADPITGAWDLPKNCVPVADTQQQLRDLTTKHVHAVDVWIGRMDASALRSKLIPLASKAYDAAVAGDKPTAIQAMTTIRETVQPMINQNPWFEIFRDSNVSLALLTQPVPAT